MKNIVKCYKHFFGYFNALKTHGELLTIHKKHFFVYIALGLSVLRFIKLLVIYLNENIFTENLLLA